jgi:hypothetical protein
MTILHGIVGGREVEYDNSARNCRCTDYGLVKDGNSAEREL